MRTLAQIISLTVVGRALKPRGGLKWLRKTRLLLKKRHPAAPCSDQHPSQKAPEFPVDLVQAPHTISDTCCQWEAVSRFLPGHWLHRLCQCHSQEPLVSSTELYQPGLWAQWLQMCSPFQPHSPTNPQHGCNSVKFPPVDLNRKSFFFHGVNPLKSAHSRKPRKEWIRQGSSCHRLRCASTLPKGPCSFCPVQF